MYEKGQQGKGRISNALHSSLLSDAEVTSLYGKSHSLIPGEHLIIPFECLKLRGRGERLRLVGAISQP